MSEHPAWREDMKNEARISTCEAIAYLREIGHTDDDIAGFLETYARALRDGSTELHDIDP